MKKESKSIHLVVIVFFFPLVRGIRCSEVTFVAVVKICRERLFNKHAIEHMLLEDASEIISVIYTSPESMYRDPWIRGADREHLGLSEISEGTQSNHQLMATFHHKPLKQSFSSHFTHSERIPLPFERSLFNFRVI